jgi:aspartyl-tRNA(Asn)/glutamyl-tRNA(Gln) amidotransferase subunit C
LINARAAQYRHQQGISPTFYLIICQKFAGRNCKNACLIGHFDKFLSLLEHVFAIFKTLSQRLARLSTMSLALSDVKRLAHLAQLELTEDQAIQTLDKLNGIFALVEQMKAIDTTGIEPLNHPIAAFQQDLALRLREDAVIEPNRRDEYQKVAPATQDGLYLVPKVIE